MLLLLIMQTVQTYCFVHNLIYFLKSEIKKKKKTSFDKFLKVQNDK